MKFPSVERLTNLLLMVLLLAAVVAQNGKLFGKANAEWFESDRPVTPLTPPTAEQLNAAGFPNATTTKVQDGIWDITVGSKAAAKTVGKVIATLEHNRKTFGFAGPIPMFLFLGPDDTIQGIEILKNSEDEKFMVSSIDHGVLSQWEGLGIEDALALKPDAVTGATMSSKAINTSIERSLTVLSTGNAAGGSALHVGIKDVMALLVLAFGVFAAYYARKRPILRPILLAVNAVVLGFWCGKFISFSTLLGYTENGISLGTHLTGAAVLLLAVAMPLFFGKKSYYCQWVCPFGAAQELAGKVMKRRRIPQQAMAVLRHTRKFITVGIFAAMWLGVSANIVGYEPFSAFLFQHASIAVLAIAGLSLVIALFTPRPWCRFACPTGQTLKWMEKLS